MFWSVRWSHSGEERQNKTRNNWAEGRVCTSPPGDVVWLKLQPGSLILPGSLFPFVIERARDGQRERRRFSHGRTPPPNLRNIKWLPSSSAVPSQPPLPVMIFWAFICCSGRCSLPICDEMVAASVVAAMKQCCILISVWRGQTCVTLQVGSPVVLFCFHFPFFFANVPSPTGCNCYNNMHRALLEC